MFYQVLITQRAMLYKNYLTLSLFGVTHTNFLKPFHKIGSQMWRPSWIMAAILKILKPYVYFFKDTYSCYICAKFHVLKCCRKKVISKNVIHIEVHMNTEVTMETGDLRCVRTRNF